LDDLVPFLLFLNPLELFFDDLLLFFLPDLDAFLFLFDYLEVFCFLLADFFEDLDLLFFTDFALLLLDDLLPFTDLEVVFAFEILNFLFF